MSILVDKNTRLVVQGITGRDGSFHTGQMIKYGTKIVAGVTHGKGGMEVEGVPVFNTVEEAVKRPTPMQQLYLCLLNSQRVQFTNRLMRE